MPTIGETMQVSSKSIDPTVVQDKVKMKVSVVADAGGGGVQL